MSVFQLSLSLSCQTYFKIELSPVYVKQWNRGHYGWVTLIESKILEVFCERVRTSSREDVLVLLVNRSGREVCPLRIRVCWLMLRKSLLLKVCSNSTEEPELWTITGYVKLHSNVQIIGCNWRSACSSTSLIRVSWLMLRAELLILILTRTLRNFHCYNRRMVPDPWGFLATLDMSKIKLWPCITQHRHISFRYQNWLPSKYSSYKWFEMVPLPSITRNDLDVVGG